MLATNRQHVNILCRDSLLHECKQIVYNDSMTIGTRLKELREAFGLSQDEVASALGWDGKRARISNYENDKRRPSAEDIEKFAKVFKTSPSYLQFGEVKDENFTLQNKKGKILPFLELDQVDDWISNPVLTADHRSVNMHIDTSDIGETSFLIEINGDSLVSFHDHPDNIYPGEIAVVDPEVAPAINDFILFDRDGEKKVRKLSIDGNQKILSALNPKYPNIHVDEKIKIKGVVVYTYKKRKH
jgi:transcriptional regulator with XRE-family HTH domain